MGADQPSEPDLGATGLWQGVPTLRRGEEAAVTPRGHAPAYPPLLWSRLQSVGAETGGCAPRPCQEQLGKPVRARRQCSALGAGLLTYLMSSHTSGP